MRYMAVAFTLRIYAEINFTHPPLSQTFRFQSGSPKNFDGATPIILEKQREK